MRQSDFTIVNQIYTGQENTLVLVGTALDGPSNIPFVLGPDADHYQLLGTSPLADAANAAKRAGATKVVLYRLNGEHATASIKNSLGVEIIRLRSVCASEKYNDIRIIIYSDYLYVIGTDSIPRSYFFDRYKTANELAYAINRDAFYGLLEFNADSLDDTYLLANMVSTAVETVFSGGLSESNLVTVRNPSASTFTSNDYIFPALKTRLEKAFFGGDALDIQERQPNSNLGMLHCGVIAVCDMYHDDNPEFTEILASFCLNKQKETGSGCIGVIGTKPIYPDDVYNLLDVEGYVSNLVSISEATVDMEAYQCVQVVPGQVSYPESDEEIVSLAYGYAATQAKFPYYTMMSNKPIHGLGKLNIEFSKEDIALLTANGYTCIVPSIRKGNVPYYSASYSKDKESIMSRPHNLRIAQYVSYMLTEELDSLIGYSHTALSIKDAIEKAQEILNSLVKNKIVKNYTMSYELLNRNTQLNIEVSLTTFSEIKAINSIATISFPQGVVV